MSTSFEKCLHKAEWSWQAATPFGLVLGAALLVGTPVLPAQETPQPEFILAWGQAGDQRGEFHSPIGLAISQQDEIFVTDLNNGRLQRFTAEGKHWGGFDLPFDMPPKRQSLAGGIAIAGSGLIYTSYMQQHKIRVHTPAGELVREWGEQGPGEGQLFGPGGIVMGPDQTLYVADQRNHRVVQFTLDGKFVAKWGQHGGAAGQFGGSESAGSRFAGPHFLARDSQGRIYTTEGKHSRVQVFSPVGEPLLAFGRADDEPGGFGLPEKANAGGLHGLIGIAVDRAGRVWCSSLNDRVQCFTPEGKFLLSLKSSEAGDFAQPHGLAFDSHGCLYVADAGNQRIVKFGFVNTVKQRKTAVAIVGDAFHLNGRPTYAGRQWEGHKIEGLLLNSRMVQGTFDDLNPETQGNWAYPDTGRWDAERNTREFVAAMPEWQRHGLLAITLNLQGGSPQGYSKAQPWHNSAITPDGNLRPEYMARLERILDQADELGMVAILGIFYFGQDERLPDEAVVKRAVERTVDWIFDRGYTNVLIEINNECNVRYDHAILQPERVHELIELVKSRMREGRRLLVGTSYGGGTVPQENVVRASDFLLIHGNGVGQPKRIAEMVSECRQVPGYRPMPILCNEDDHFGFDQPEYNFRAAVSEYASWGYFDFRMQGEGFDDGYQSVPVNWGLSSPRKQAFFEKLVEITGSAGNR